MSTQDEAKSRVSFAEAFPIIKKKAREFLKSSLQPNLTTRVESGGDMEIQVEVPREKRFLWWTYAARGKNRIGELRFNFDGPKLSKQKNENRWALLVYGCEHVQLFMTLAEQLASKFDVEVHVRLETEKVVELH